MECEDSSISSIEIFIVNHDCRDFADTQSPLFFGISHLPDYIYSRSEDK